MLQLFSKDPQARNRTTVAALLLLSVGATACGGGSDGNTQIPGVSGPDVALIDNKFIMTVGLDNVHIDQGISIPIHPRMPNSGLTIGPNIATEGMLIQLVISVVDLAALTGGGVVPFDPMTLPGGRPLPTVAQGYLPGIAVQVPAWRNLAFYLSRANFGVFVPVDLPWAQVGGSFRFKKNGKTIGTLSIVPRDNQGLNAGFLLLINFQGQVAQVVRAAGGLR